MPELRPTNRAVLKLFQASYSAIDYISAGLDAAVPKGHNMSQVATIAEGLGIDWTESLVSGFQFLSNKWIEILIERRKADRAKK
jgi:hypothetical protein